MANCSAVIFSPRWSFINRQLSRRSECCGKSASCPVAAALKQDVAAAGQAASLPLGPSYPIRRIEKAALSWAAEQTGNAHLGTLLGCLLYHFGQWEEAEKLFRKDSSALGLRNSALVWMAAARKADPASQQLVYETAVLLDKTGRDPQEKIRLLTEFPITRANYLMALIRNAAGEDAREQLAQSDALASENLFALSFEKQGFLE